MTTTNASSTIEIALSSPAYTNPIVINPGVALSSNGNIISAAADFWTIENYGSIRSTNPSGPASL
jgi:hypothetical protein